VSRARSPLSVSWSGRRFSTGLRPPLLLPAADDGVTPALCGLLERARLSRFGHRAAARPPSVDPTSRLPSGLPCLLGLAHMCRSGRPHTREARPPKSPASPLPCVPAPRSSGGAAPPLLRVRAPRPRVPAPRSPPVGRRRSVGGCVAVSPSPRAPALAFSTGDYRERKTGFEPATLTLAR
jgi:hypothetical protein